MDNIVNYKLVEKELNTTVINKKYKSVHKPFHNKI
jgi:hypothetical protein